MSHSTKKLSTLLSANLLTSDQIDAVNRLYQHDQTMMIAKMGAGKTVISLTAIVDLLEDEIVDRVLVFAPLKVVRTVWRQEAEKWEHTARVNVVLCEGTPAQREKIVAKCQQQKGIMLVGLDLMQWFFQTYKKTHGFDGLLIDELSKLKAGGKGFKKMRPHLKTFKWRAGLTGTPCSEDFEGLFYQTYALDAGERFGGRRDSYLKKYFTPTDYNEYNWELRPEGAGLITKLLAGLVYTVPDYRHELPELRIASTLVGLPDSAQQVYDQFDKASVLELDGYPVQTAENAAVLSGKLQQLASGALYIDDEFGERLGVEVFHDAKITACDLLVRGFNEPVIICYWFKHELARLEQAFPNAVNLNDEGAQEAWNEGRVNVLLMQPMSASHGIQLQHGGRNMIFFTPIWSNDIVEQTIARVWRQGQKRTVNVREIVAVGTVDEAVVERVNGKKRFDDLFHDLI